MTQMPSMTSDVIYNLQNLMLMTKLSEGVEVYIQGNGQQAKRFVVMNGIPMDFRHFVQLAACVIRGSGQAQYDDKFWDQMFELWDAVEYKHSPFKNKSTNMLRTAFYETVKKFSAKSEDGIIDFKPLMAEVYEKFADWES
jgi:hypothetical protein